MLKIHQLEIGKLVEIKGLVSKPEKNGLIGRLIGFDEDSGRWRVKLRSSNENLAVKPDNLWALAEDASLPFQSTEPTMPVLQHRSPLSNSANGGKNMGYESCDVAFLSNPANALNREDVALEDFCCYDLVDSGLKLGSLSLTAGKDLSPGSFRPTGHGLLLRGVVSIPSPLGYVEGVQLFEENIKKFVAVSNVHKQAILILCGPAALARLEQCRKLDISAWITTGANIQPIRMPVSRLGYLHDWTDIEPEGPSDPPRAAYIEDRNGQYFLRVAKCSITSGQVISDDNTDPVTQADDLSQIDPEWVVLYGPLPVDWPARGCEPPKPRSRVLYSEDPADLLLSKLQIKMGMSWSVICQGKLPDIPEPPAWTGLTAVDLPGADPNALAATDDDYDDNDCSPEGLFARGHALEDADPTAAFALYRRAAQAGHAGGLSKAGWAKLTGAAGEARDPAEGLRLTRRAAELGDAMAQCNLASCYLQGLVEGEGGDSREKAAAAAGWYRRAAAQGLGMAEWNLGFLLVEGFAEAQAGEDGLELLRHASREGEAGAHFHLGRLYEEGRAGLPRDPVRALELYRAAAAGGFEPARSILSAGGLMGH